MKLSSAGLRVSPRRMTVGEVDWAGDAPAMVDQVEWASYVPLFHRVLANPTGGEFVPETPRPGDAHEDFLSFWYPALYLLVYNLGWTDPGLGLHRWMAAGRPTDDLRFALLRRIWDSNDALDLLAAWLWSSDWGWPNQIRGALGLAPVEVRKVDPGRDWWERLEARREASGDARVYTPYFGGGDPMHLQTHIPGPVEGDAGTSSFLSRPQDRTAVLVLERMRGWYRALADAGRSLPDLADRSWHVEVVCKPVGWLGTYRQSRVTGLWFAGPHSIHMIGNRVPPTRPDPFDIRLEEVPRRGQDWCAFAVSFNGYKWAGDRCLEIGNEVRERYAASQMLPDDLATLRTALFAENRDLHWSSFGPDETEIDFVWALIERIREVVRDGKPPK